MNYIFLLAGILIFNIGRYIIARRKKSSVWTWKKFLIDNGLPSLISLIVGCSLILGKSISDETIEFAVSILTLKINIYLMLGILTDVLVKKLFEISKTSKK